VIVTIEGQGGLFYGIGYLARVMLDPTRLAKCMGKNEDLDSSEDICRLLISLTGYGEHVVPPCFFPRRVAECLMSRQGSLTAKHVGMRTLRMVRRRARSQFGSELNGWAPVWQTDSNWALAAYLRHDPAMRPFASGFDARSILPPTCGWKCVDAEFQAMVLNEACVLQLASRPESSSI
jgi:hypothetical protein